MDELIALVRKLREDDDDLSRLQFELDALFDRNPDDPAFRDLECLYNALEKD